MIKIQLQFLYNIFITALKEGGINPYYKPGILYIKYFVWFFVWGFMSTSTS